MAIIIAIARMRKLKHIWKMPKVTQMGKGETAFKDETGF